jgi:tetratricopeptide (TPR) repeat protein
MGRTPATSMPVAFELISDLIHSKRAIFLCGAGVSAASGIPFVDPLLNEIGRLAELDILDIDAMKSIQFEYLLTRLQEAVSIRALVKIFQRENPTIAHHVLATLHGPTGLSHLLTTNFDVNFELAFERRKKAYAIIYTLDELRSFPESQPISPCIVKIHGSSHDLASLRILDTGVASTSQYLAVQGLFRSLFSREQKRVLIALGYSMSDRFDVKPALSQLRAEGTQIPVLLWRHFPLSEQEDADPKAVTAFLNGEQAHLAIKGHTPSMLTAIAKSFAVELPDDAEPADGAEWKACVASWWDGMADLDRRRARAAIYLAAGRHLRYVECMEQAQRSGSESRLPDEFVCSLGAIYNDLRRPADAVPHLDSIIGTSEAWNTENKVGRRTMSFALLERARSTAMLGELDDALSYLERARARLLDLPFLLFPHIRKEEVDPDEGDAYLWVNWLHYGAAILKQRGGNEAEALDMLEKAAALAERAGMLLRAYLLQVESARLRLECALHLDDERLMVGIIKRLTRAKERYAAVFSDDDAIVRQIDDKIGAVATFLLIYDKLGWQGLKKLWQRLEEQPRVGSDT